MLNNAEGRVGASAQIKKLLGDGRALFTGM
jgi:hypothetical protein